MMLKYSALVVNKDPDIPLKVDPNFKTPELFLNKKQVNLQKMTTAKVKLDILAEKSKEKFKKKLEDEKEKMEKLKELIEYDEYEKAQRLAAEKEKQRNAIKRLEKINKEIEKKQMKDYKDHLYEVELKEQQNLMKQIEIEKAQYKQMR